MNRAIADDLVPPPVQAVLALFTDELAELKFPDLDQQILQQSLDRLLADAQAQSQAEAALHAAREALHDSQEALLQKCQRAMAYARVYAEDNAPLLQRVEQISLPRSSRSRTPSPAGSSDSRPAGRRSRRPPTASAPLFLEPPPAQQAA